MIITREEYFYEEPVVDEDDIEVESEVKKFSTFDFLITEGVFSDIAHKIKVKSEEKAREKANVKYGTVVPAYRKYLELFMQHQEDILKNLYDYCLKISKGKIDEEGVKKFVKDRDAIQAKVSGNADLLATARNLNTVNFYKACQKSPEIKEDLKALAKDCAANGKYVKRATRMADDFNKIFKLIDKISNDSNFSSDVYNWLATEYNISVQDYDTLKTDIVTPTIIYNKLATTVGESSSLVEDEEKTFDPSKYFSFQDEDKINPSLFDDEKVFYRDPVYNKAITEYFDMTDRKTTKVLTHLNEAGQNTVLMNLTSKLYDKIVSKCDEIDYGEIPATKGDITKLSKYEDMKETISIMHDILKEYKQDTGPVDELSVALSNVEARKDLFERAYRYNSELPIAMYCNVVLGIITGISYMIATSIEFIKDPGTDSFRIALDKMSYARTKDHMIYSTLKSFNKSCANKDFDKAMEAVLKASTKNFTGGVVLGGIAVGIIGTILVLIPVLRELIFLFYYTRMRISDFFDIQADLLQANAYSLESNSTLDVNEQKKIKEKQLKTVDHFRKISNTFAIDIKKAEVASAKEKKQDDESKMLIDDIEGLDSNSGSALF